MKSRMLVLLAAIAMVLGSASDSEARNRPRRAKSDFKANKGFGLGIMFGAPFGLSGKYYLSESTALDFGVGAYYRFRYDDAFQFHVDYLWHPVVLAKTDAFWLPLYVGVGGRVLDHGRDRDRDFDDDTHVGVRAPLGLSFDFENVPLDIFFEFALVVDFIQDRDDNHDIVDLNSSVGIRYYFN